MDVVSDEGIVLSSMKYSESSKIIKVFTKSKGKISLIAKGAFSKKNKFGSSIEPSSISDFTFYFKEGKELYTLSESSFAYKYKNSFSDINRVSCTFIILEILDFSISATEQNKQAYNLSVQFLKNNDDKNLNAQLNLIEFICCYLTIMGYKFNLEKITYHLSLYFSRNEKNKLNLSRKATLTLNDLTPIKKNYDNKIKCVQLSLNALTFIQRIEELTNISTIAQNNANADNFIELHAEQNEQLRFELNEQLNNYLFFELVDFFVEYFSYHFDKRLMLNSLKLIKGVES